MKKGDRYIFEIEEVHTHYNDNEKPYKLGRVKGFNSLVFDDSGLNKLLKVPTCFEMADKEKEFKEEKHEMINKIARFIYETHDIVFLSNTAENEVVECAEDLARLFEKVVEKGTTENE